MRPAKPCLLLLSMTACVTFSEPSEDASTGTTSGPGPGSTDPTPTGGQPSPTGSAGDDTDAPAPDDTDAPAPDLPDPSTGDSEPATGEPPPPPPDPVVSELARFDRIDLGDVDG